MPPRVSTTTRPTARPTTPPSTTCRASAPEPAWVTPVGQRPTRRARNHVSGLPPHEPRHPPLVDSVDAFLEVGGLAQAGLLDELLVGGGTHAVGKAGAHRRARGDDAQRRALGDLFGELLRRGAHLGLR